MKTYLLSVVCILVFLTSCGEKPNVMSNEHCSIQYHEEYKEFAKEVYQELTFFPEANSEVTQRQVSILNEGDKAVFKLDCSDEMLLKTNYLMFFSAYYFDQYLSSKTAKFQYLKGKEVKVSIDSDELPQIYKDVNLSIIVDRNIPASDKKKIEKWLKTSGLPQECRFWIKINKAGYYVCNYISNTNWYMEEEVYETITKGREYQKLFQKIGLSKDLEMGYMNLDFQKVV